jgi:heme-degrading monooxygenase HmoA
MKGVFLWKVRPGMEAEFERRWVAGSERWQRKPGARGTRLHRGVEDGSLYLGYASWESLGHRQRAEEMMRAEEAAEPALFEVSRTDHVAEFSLVGFFDEPHVSVMPEGMAGGQS